MNKGVVSLFFLILAVCLVFPLSSAIQTNVEVKTSADYSVVLRIIDPQTKETMNTVYGKANNAGIAQLNLETIKSELSFIVIIVYDGEVITTKETGVYQTNQKIFINLDETPTVSPTSESLPIANSTSNESEVVPEILPSATVETTAEIAIPTSETIDQQQESPQNSSQLTGLAISEGNSNYSKIIIYLTIIVLIGGIILFFMQKRNKSNDEDDIINHIIAKKEGRISTDQPITPQKEIINSTSPQIRSTIIEKKSAPVKNDPYASMGRTRSFSSNSKNGRFQN